MTQRRAHSRRARVSTTELLQRLIPVEGLDAEGRKEYMRLLAMEDEGARLAGASALLERLCESGYLRRVSSSQADGSVRVTYRNLSTLDTISLTLPRPATSGTVPEPAALPESGGVSGGRAGTPTGRRLPGKRADGTTRLDAAPTTEGAPPSYGVRPSVDAGGRGIDDRQIDHAIDGRGRRQTFLPRSILEAVAASSRRIDLASAMSYLYDLLADVVGYESCAVFMSSGLSDSPAGRLSELEEVFRWVDSDMIAPRDLKLKVEQTGTIVAIPDMSDAGRFARHLSKRASGSLLVAALRAEAYVYGILEIWSESAHAYTSDEVATVDFVAEFIGGLIKRRLEIEELIFVDQTSQIHNRRYFDEQLAREVERCRRTGNSMALLIGDLDNFKQVNDTMGHAAGDSVLRQVGRILSENARQLDIVARFGGEEFGVILPNVERDTARTVAERMRSTIAEHRFVTGVRETPTCGVTMSIGGALYPLDAKSRADLIDKADRIALFEAKRRGKNRVIFWEDIQSERGDASAGGDRPERGDASAGADRPESGDLSEGADRPERDNQSE